MGAGNETKIDCLKVKLTLGTGTGTGTEIRSQA